MDAIIDLGAGPTACGLDRVSVVSASHRPAGALQFPSFHWSHQKTSAAGHVQRLSTDPHGHIGIISTLHSSCGLRYHLLDTNCLLYSLLPLQDQDQDQDEDIKENRPNERPEAHSSMIYICIMSRSSSPHVYDSSLERP